MASTDRVMQAWQMEAARLERRIERAEMEIQDAKQRLDRLGVAMDEYRKVTSTAVAVDVTAEAAPDASVTATIGSTIVRMDAAVEDQVLQVFRDDPDRIMTAKEVLERLTAGGWTTTSVNPEAMVMNYLSRLWRKRKLQRPSKGKYRFALPDNTEGPASAGPSVMFSVP